MTTLSWIKSALKEFKKFPEGAQSICKTALTIAAEGGKADLAKPINGFGPGVLEIAYRTRGTPFAWCTPFRLEKSFGLCMPFRKRRQKE
jgi:phage-related protein